MVVADELELGREAYARRAWVDAYRALAQARLDDDPEDLVRLATAACLIGRDDEGCDLFGRAYTAFLARDDVDGAARCAFWTSVNLAARGLEAPAGGWLARARRLADTAPPDSLVAGYLHAAAGRGAVESGALEAAAQEYDAAASGAELHEEADLLAIARLGQGQTRALLGDVAAGGVLLDEAMVAVTSGEVSQLTAGVVYCAVVSFCQTTLDVRRARQWTAQLTRWCAEQPDLVPFAGECLIHRSQVLLGLDDWGEALAAADRAVARLTGPPVRPMLGLAWAQKADVHRLRGELDAAEDAYLTANRLGEPPGAGLALLRLAQGRTRSAADLVHALLADPGALTPDTLGAAVEVLLAAGDEETAARVCDALGASGSTDAVVGIAARARGELALSRGDPARAVRELRVSWAAWQRAALIYEGARTRALLARALQAAGDRDAAALERDAARWTFTQLGARTDLAALDRPASSGTVLTAREVEVLRAVATGRTNREVARELGLSEKTVARHLANVFVKLDVPSRAAATAYAYEHGLV
jgi:DNA-binding CsgD family transcriptional regulator